jgi:hypothetical protein
VIDCPPLFAAVSIQTNSRCNLQCPFCFYGQYRDYGTDEIIATDVVLKILNELAALNYRGRISLYNMNEPLTDGRIVDLLALASSCLPDCIHFLSTNGVLLTQLLLERILAQVDRLRINRYGRIPALDYSDPRIALQEKRDFLPHAGSNRGGSLHNLPAAARPGKGTCANPFGQMVIMPPGIAVLCCADGFKQVRMGDVRTESLAQIWYGPGFQAVRARLTAGQRDALPLCRTCSVDGGGFYEYFLDPSHFERTIAHFCALHVRHTEDALNHL